MPATCVQGIRNLKSDSPQKDALAFVPSSNLMLIGIPGADLGNYRAAWVPELESKGELPRAN